MIIVLVHWLFQENKLEFEETKGDLFSCADTSSLAHCISADVRMGKGIATIFKKKFQGVKELLDQGYYFLKRYYLS